MDRTFSLVHECFTNLRRKKINQLHQHIGITRYRLAKEIGVPQRRIGEIVMGKRAVTPDTGLRLSRFFGMSDGFWVGLQTDYDLAVTRHAMQAVLNKIQRYDVHAA